MQTAPRPEKEHSFPFLTEELTLQIRPLFAGHYPMLQQWKYQTIRFKYRRNNTVPPHNHTKVKYDCHYSLKTTEILPPSTYVNAERLFRKWRLFFFRYRLRKWVHQYKIMLRSDYLRRSVLKNTEDEFAKATIWWYAWPGISWSIKNAISWHSWRNKWIWYKIMRRRKHYV